MQPLHTLFKEARAITKQNYRSYLKLFALIAGTIFLLIIANVVVSNQQQSLDTALQTYVQQNMSVDLGEVIDENDTVKKMQLDQEIAKLTTEFYLKSENIPYFIFLVLFVVIMALMQNIMKLGITQTAWNLSVTPTSYTWMDFLKPSNKVIQIIITNLISSIFIFFGFIIFIIPGIYITIRLSFIDYALVVDNTTIWGAIKHSRKITKGKAWYLFKTYFLFFVMQFVGTILLIVGLFWTLPRMRTIQGMLYRKLNASTTPLEVATA